MLIELPVLCLALAAPSATAAPALSLFEALQLLAFVLLVVVVVSQQRLSSRLDALERRRPAPAAPAMVTPPPPAAADAPLSARTLIILAAAATEACGEPVRIIAIREHAPPNAAAWSLEGRRHIFASHTTR
jgi:hypothetical protein